MNDWSGSSKLLQCSALQCAVSIRKLNSVAELIAEQNADIQVPMANCINELNRMVAIIEDQCEQLDSSERTVLNKLFYSCLKHTLNLLSRLLQLVDIGLLKPLLSTNQPAVHFRRLTDVTNFTELTKAYTQLVLELMQLVQMVSNKTNKDPDRDERRRTRLYMQQQLSQRCIILILTCCKTCVDYPCPFAANNRTMLLKQMRKSLDHIQEQLLLQFTASVLGVCTVPTNSSINQSSALPPTDDCYSNFVKPNLVTFNPITTIYRSIPQEQIYLPYYFDKSKYCKLFYSPFFASNDNIYKNNNFYSSNQLKLFNPFNRAGTLSTNENCKLININKFFDTVLASDYNCARQSTSNYFGPLIQQNLYFDKSRNLNIVTPTNCENYRYPPIKQPFQKPIQEPDRCFESANKFGTAFSLPKRETHQGYLGNISRSTNYSNSIITHGSDINPSQYNEQRTSQLTEPYASATDGSRSADSPCLPYYASNLIPDTSSNDSFYLFNSLSYLNDPNLHLAHQSLHSQNVQHHYLLCQLNILQQQQHQYYDNLYTSAFYNQDTEPNASIKTDQCLTIHNLLCSFEDLISLSRLTCQSQAFRERISQCLDLGAELSQDFTDSPYTSHCHREKIILLNERVLLELNQLLRIGSQMEKLDIPTENLEAIICQILQTCAELKQQLQQATLEQAHFLFKQSNPFELLNELRKSILAGDQTSYVIQIDLYIEHYEHLRDLTCHLHHIAPTQNQQIRTKHAHFCVTIFAPMVLNAIQTLINHFNPQLDSKMSLANYQVFFDFWIQLYVDIYDLFCLIVEKIGLRASDKYLSVLPAQQPAQSHQPILSTVHPAHSMPPTKQQAAQPTVPSNIVEDNINNINNQKFQIPEIVEPSTSTAQTSVDKTPSNYCSNCCTCEQSRASCNRQNGLNQNQMDELARKRSLEENEIVEKCTKMTQFVQTMLEFTNGIGELKTTQDLFTQAESFGDEANKFYKIVRYLTYQIPSGQLKEDLRSDLDKIPHFVQELNFAIKNSTIGAAATLTKVDQVLNQVQQLLKFVQNTTHLSIQCAKRYNLDLESINSGRISPMFTEDTGVRSRTGTSRKQAQQSSDSRRTRVSFLLF